MASDTFTLRYSAEQLFDLTKDGFDPDLHEALRIELAAIFPEGIRVPVRLVAGRGRMPTQH
jgi:hypothetical protein